ncbi:MAG TPA: polysaccharide deacetylase family protein, partial [Acidimicrobiales bacterium]|nr:polysaccharide deacetylase family protein [Acidimicrobiales bacterium]
MFFHVDIKGDGLPPKTLCLTYDDGPGATAGDGPGPRTDELGAYLHSRGIAATFFVIGRHAAAHRDILDRLRDRRHLIGNHTDSHPGLVSLAASGGDVVGEIARTDEIITPYAEIGVRFLRAPYGNWRETEAADGAPRDRPISIVARALNRSGRFRDHVGPINWDISGEDYDFWKEGRPAEDCARRYLERIRPVGRGIILMHDSSEDAGLRAGNRALEVTKLIVPALEAEGYRFIRLDAIPQVQTAMAVTSLVALRTGEDRYLGWSDEPRGRIVAEARSVGAREQFGVVELDADRIALRAG